MCLCIGVLCVYVCVIARHVAPRIEVRARLGQIDNPFNPKNITSPMEMNSKVLEVSSSNIAIVRKGEERKIMVSYSLARRGTNDF